MLVLSRKVGQRIVIGNGITVVINRVSGSHVAIGIQAPRHIPIRRGELEPLDERGSQANDADLCLARG